MVGRQRNMAVKEDSLSRKCSEKDEDDDGGQGVEAVIQG
jgi:hypothetical protein